MLKRMILLFGTLLLGGLIACQSPTPTSKPATVVPTPEPTATPLAPTPTLEPTATPMPEDTPAPGAVADKPSPTPTTPWQIPEVQADDWLQGGASAGLTLIVYGDFQ